LGIIIAIVSLSAFVKYIETKIAFDRQAILNSKAAVLQFKIIRRDGRHHKEEK